MKISKFHQLIRSRKMFMVFTWLIRILLSMAFIPSGIVKVKGLRFTQISIENPVGFFFEAMYQTGIYWNFLGLVQLTAAILILIPRTTFLGAIIYFPVLINICVIVISMNFLGTPIITSLMLLGNLYLFFWDLPKTRALLKTIFLSTHSFIHRTDNLG